MGVSDPSRRPDCTAQGSSEGKVKVTSVCKNQWGLGQWKKLPVSQESLFKGHGLRMYANTSTLEITTRATARRAPVSYEKWVK